MICLYALAQSTSATGSTPVFKPTPVENSLSGRNSHAYSPSTNGLTQTQREGFVEQVAAYAIPASEKWGIPASAIIGMAIIESGYGTTRIAYHANNLFGIKVWGVSPANAWQLIGQPDEDFARAIPLLANYGDDRKVFDETTRRDNWYRIFTTYEDAVNYLAGTLLLNTRYRPAQNAYQERVQNGWTYEAASKQYLFDIAHAGYNHLGGNYYRNTVGRIMDQWNLYHYDVLANSQAMFRDVRLHWAKGAVEELAQLNIISGFPDGTFRPNESVTREQFVKMLVEAKGLKLRYGQSFSDVSNQQWSNPYIETALYYGILTKEDYGQHFQPELNISRQEMAILSARTLQLSPVQASLPFTDRSIIQEHPELVGAAVKQGIMIGYEDNTFKPYHASTRAEAAIVIKRVLDHLK